MVGALGGMLVMGGAAVPHAPSPGEARLPPPRREETGHSQRCSHGKTSCGFKDTGFPARANGQGGHDARSSRESFPTAPAPRPRRPVPSPSDFVPGSEGRRASAPIGGCCHPEAKSSPAAPSLTGSSLLLPGWRLQADRSDGVPLGGIRPIGAQELPNQPPLRRDFRGSSPVRLGNQRVAVRQPLHRSLARAVEGGRRLPLPLPCHRATYRIHFDNA